MKNFLLIVLCALYAADIVSCIQYPDRPSSEEGWRLIQFSQTHIEWIPTKAIHLSSALLEDDSKVFKLDPVFHSISREAVKALTGRVSGKADLGVGFIDRTLHYNSGASSFEPMDVPTPTYPTPNPDNNKIVFDMYDKINVDNMKATVDDLSNLHTRYYLSSMSTKAPEYLKSKIKEIIKQYNSKYISIVDIPNSGFDQNNVVAILHADKDNGDGDNSIVVVGGHLDSTTGGDPTDKRAPGADDDASGSSIVLETLRLIAQSGWRGKHDVHFMFFAAEEGGLLGSNTVANQYKSDNINIRAMLQMEMCGYQLNDIPVITVLNDPNPKVSSYLSSLISKYVSNITLNHSLCGYGCSDHDSFNDVGYPSGCISEAGPNDEGLNPYMHTIKDVSSILNYDAMTVFVKAGIAYIIELAQ